MTKPRAAKRAEAPRYRMKELTALTGVERPVVHFYIQQGLVPPGHKTGRNTAWYGEEHVRRIRLVRQLQEERFLPLKAIKAALDAERGAFSEAQRATMVDAMHRLGDALRPAGRASARVPVDELGLERADLTGLAELGVLHVGRDERGRPVVPRDDLWVVQLWAELRDAGFTKARGFTTRDLAVYVEAVARFLDHETRWLERVVDQVAPEQLARMVERGLPLLHSFLTRHHESRIKALMATIAEGRDA